MLRVLAFRRLAATTFAYGTLCGIVGCSAFTGQRIVVELPVGTTASYVDSTGRPVSLGVPSGESLTNVENAVRPPSSPGNQTTATSPDSTAPVVPPAIDVEPKVLERYELRPGDRLELIYTDKWPVEGDYRLMPGDQLRIEYLHLFATNPGDQNLDRTVWVQPDGKLSLPYIGVVVGTGKTVAELNTELNSRYEEFYVDPQVHATLEKTGAGLQGLWESLRASGNRLATIGPDGVIGAPFLGPVNAAGMTITELQEELRLRYNRVARNLLVTVRLNWAATLENKQRPAGKSLPSAAAPVRNESDAPVGSSAPRSDATVN